MIDRYNKIKTNRVTVLKNLLLITVFSILAISCSRERHYSVVPAKSTIVILGDSLTYGTGANKGEDYASLLASSTGWNVINAGVPGDTSSDGLERLPAILADNKVDLLIVELGGNDFLQHLPEKETVNNLKAILAQAKSKQIQTALLAIPEFSPISAAVGNLSDHPLYAKIAKETDTPLFENVFSDVLEKNRLKSDQIHPNAEGYRIVEEHLRKILTKMGFLAGK